MNLSLLLILFGNDIHKFLTSAQQRQEDKLVALRQICIGVGVYPVYQHDTQVLPRQLEILDDLLNGGFRRIAANFALEASGLE
jgi:hypothetical protein